MIPVALTLKGLYSYQQEQTIDFTRLLEGQLFGIFGAVGSGKSTILEAISFALYGETERLNQRDNRNYNMMNLKSDELLIDFTFANFDQQLYRFTVKGKRAGNDFETVRTFQRNAYQKVSDRWEPLESASAEGIIGLSYENFRRTIIIPQGKFQEFLQLGDKARTDMLKDIFHLGKYEFFYQTASLEKKNNEKIQNLRGQMERYKELTFESLKEKQEVVYQLTAELQEIRKQLQEKEKLEKEQLELKKLFEELNQKKDVFANLKSREDHFKQQEKKLDDYEYCLRHFKDKLSRQKELRQSIEIKEKTIRDNTAQLATLTEKSDRQEVVLEQAKQELKNQDHRKAQLEDYTHLLTLLSLEKSLAELNKRAADGDSYVQKEADAGKQMQENLEIQKNELKTKKASLPDMKVLSEVNHWFLTHEHIQKTKKEIEKEISEQQSFLQAVHEGAGKHLPSFLVNGVPAKDLSIAGCLRLIEEFTAKNQQWSDELQEQISHFQVQVKLGEFAEQLHAGRPCPLCGSKEHPEVLKVEDVNEHLNATARQMEEIKDQQKACEKASHKYRELKISEENYKQQIATLITKLQQIDAELQEHIGLFRWTEFHPDKKEYVSEAFQTAEEVNRLISQLEEKIEISERELRVNAETQEKYKKAVENIKNEITAKTSSFSTIKAQLKVLNFDEHKATPEILKKKVGNLAEEIKQVEETYERLLQESDKLKQQKISLRERINATALLLKEERHNLQTLESDLKECLEKSSYAAWEEVEAILNDQLDIGLLRNEIGQYQQQLYKSQQDVIHLEKQTQDKQFDPATFREIEEMAQTFREKTQEINDLLVKEKDALARLKADLQNKEKLEKELETLQHRADNLGVLRQLFKGNGFINYISSVYLHNLCQAANERFYHLTRQQLRLEVTENNDFQVRDFLNNGRTRSVKTLSGGQTFQASLSLALALAESVQQQNKAQQNFFFLDEGFGSLDKESLQVVFDTLKSLRKENRIVGIISHVEELQQEIDVYLKVTNHSESGSIIKRSWVEG